MVRYLGLLSLLRLLPVFPSRLLARRDRGPFLKLSLTSKALSPLAHQHHMAGFLHDAARDGDRVLESLDRSHRSSLMSRTGHDAGVQLDHTMSRGNPSKTHAGIGKVVLSQSHPLLHGVQARFSRTKHL